MTPTDNRPCTCHPDDAPPAPCARRYALVECRDIQANVMDRAQSWLNAADPIADLCERLRALHIIDEVGSDNPLGRDAADALEAAQADARRYADALFSLGAMRDPPCFFCGYDGPGYFQPNHHPCARRHHAAIAAAMKGEGDA